MQRKEHIRNKYIFFKTIICVTMINVLISLVNNLCPLSIIFLFAIFIVNKFAKVK